MVQFWMLIFEGWVRNTGRDRMSEKKSRCDLFSWVKENSSWNQLESAGISCNRSKDLCGTFEDAVTITS